ncbi:MAG TPA: ATP-binding protein [Gemmatirosa sp.]
MTGARRDNDGQDDVATSAAHDLFAGPGEMAARCRAFDWASTPLGSVVGWPVELRTAVRLMLATPVATSLWCGATYTLVYNDAYQRILGVKHPLALGRSGPEVWNEIWLGLEPQFASVRAGGPAVFADEALLRMARLEGGQDEDAWFTYALSALTDAAGHCLAVYNVAVEVSDRVRSREALAGERARLFEVSQRVPSFVSVVRGADHVLEYANEAYFAFVGRRDLVGRPVWDALPDARGQGFEALLDRVRDTGQTISGREVPVRLSTVPGGEATERFVDFVYQPLAGPDGQTWGVLGYGNDVTAKVLARREVDRLLAASELARADAEAYAAQLQEQAVELEHQTNEAQTVTDALEVTIAQLQHASERAGRLLAVAAGLSAASTPEAVADVIFREGLVALGADAGSLALVHGDGTAGAEIETVRVMGYSDPITTKYHRYAVTAGRPLSDAVLSRAPVLLESWADWCRAYPQVSADVGALGYEYEAFAVIPVIGDGRVLAALSASFRRRVPFDEGTRTFLATLGEQCGLALERARAYEAARRAEDASTFLAEASQLLAASLDYHATLRTVAEAAVPRLGDWCAVDVLDNPTAPTWPPTLARVAIVHEDPAKLELAAALAARYPTDWSAEAGMAAVIRDGTPFFVPIVTEAMLDAGARDAEHRELLRALRFSSIMVVPLVARGHTLGALTFCHTESGRHYDAADLVLAQDLARRAALAVDNARLYRDAERARAAAEEANRGKSQFLANMSHELRTPLNAIGGYVQLLEMELQGPVTPDQRASLGRVQQAQQRLLALINDVLNYAKLEGGRVEYDVRATDVRDVVADVLPLVEPLISAKGLAFDVRMPDAPCRVWADRDKLGQVLVNLLSNATKFTDAVRATGERGRITIDLAPDDAELGFDDAPGERVAVRVTDTGRGIPREKQDAIFEPFVQVRTGYAQATEGTGLGLSISRDLARGMGGDLRVQSVDGEGSTFAVVLRRAGDAAAGAADARRMTTEPGAVATA